MMMRPHVGRDTVAIKIINQLFSSFNHQSSFLFTRKIGRDTVAAPTRRRHWPREGGSESRVPKRQRGPAQPAAAAAAGVPATRIRWRVRRTCAAEAAKCIPRPKPEGEKL